MSRRPRRTRPQAMLAQLSREQLSRIESPFLSPRQRAGRAACGTRQRIGIAQVCIVPVCSCGYAVTREMPRFLAHCDEVLE